MIKAKMAIPMIALAVSLVGCTTARTDYARREYSRYSGDVAENYCHQKFRDYDSGGGRGTIDYYGPCDETRRDLGWDEHLFREHQFEKDYNS